MWPPEEGKGLAVPSLSISSHTSARYESIAHVVVRSKESILCNLGECDEHMRRPLDMGYQDPHEAVMGKLIGFRNHSRSVSVAVSIDRLWEVVQVRHGG